MIKSVIFQYLKKFINAILSGFLIGISGFVFIAVNSPIRYFLLSIGFLFILLYGYDLFCFKTTSVLENKKGYILEIILAWLGNIIGAYLIAGLLRLTSLYDSTLMKISLDGLKITMVDNRDYLHSFIGAIIGGFIIYFGYNTYKKAEQPIARYLAIFLSIAVIAICDFELVSLNMFFFGMVQPFSSLTVSSLLIITAGNILGILIVPVVKLLRSKMK